MALGGLALSIAGLVLLEQVARNTRSSHRWHLKHIWLAIGGLYAWDLCLFSIAMLRGRAEDFWLARGFVDAALGGLLAVGLSRIEVAGWESAAFLSPRVVFFNATLLAASLYVLAMAVGSYFVRELGGSWGGAGQLVFLAAGALVLAIAVLSEQFRAWGRVTLARHLFPYRYDYRDEWRKLTHALSESGELPVYERIAQVMAGFVSATSGGLWLRDPEGAYLPVGGELAPPGAPALHEADHPEFLDYLLQKEWICDLDDSRSPQGGAPPLKAPGWMLENRRIWLVVPLICEKVLVGFVAVAHPLAAVTLGWEEIDLLRAAGRQVASFLAFEQAAKRLAEAHQFEAMNRLSAFLVHDLRHLIAQQALVVQNAARHRGNPEFFDDAILTIDNSVKRMTRLMEELRRGVLTEQAQRVELAELAAEVARRTQSREPVPQLAIETRGVEVLLNRNRMLQVVEHVVRNAQDATAPPGSVSIIVRQAGPHAVLEVADTGTGMDAEFVRNRLSESRKGYALEQSRAALPTVAEESNRRELRRFREWLGRVVCSHINPFSMEARAEKEALRPRVDLANMAAGIDTSFRRVRREYLAFLQDLRKSVDGFDQLFAWKMQGRVYVFCTPSSCETAGPLKSRSASSPTDSGASSACMRSCIL